MSNQHGIVVATMSIRFDSDYRGPRISDGGSNAVAMNALLAWFKVHAVAVGCRRLYRDDVSRSASNVARYDELTAVDVP